MRCVGGEHRERHEGGDAQGVAGKGGARAEVASSSFPPDPPHLVGSSRKMMEGSFMSSMPTLTRRCGGTPRGGGGTQ